MFCTSVLEMGVVPFWELIVANLRIFLPGSDCTVVFSNFVWGGLKKIEVS